MLLVFSLESHSDVDCQACALNDLVILYGLEVACPICQLLKYFILTVIGVYHSIALVLGSYFVKQDETTFPSLCSFSTGKRFLNLLRIYKY